MTTAEEAAPTQRRALSDTARYALPVVCVALAAGAQAALGDTLRSSAFLLYYPPVIVCAWFAGFWPAVAAIVLGLMSAAIMGLAPAYTLTFAHHGDLVAAIGYCAVAFTMALLIEAQLQARYKAEESARVAQAHQARLTKEAEEKRAAQLSEQRKDRELRDFVENAAIGIFWVASDATISWANRTLHELLGYSPGELAGKALSDLMQNGDGVQEVVGRLREGQTVPSIEVQLRARDGHACYVLFSSTGLFEGDRLQYSRCMALDISERKKAQEAVREGEELYRHLAESMPQIVWTAGPDGRVDYCNRRWYEYTGLSEDQSMAYSRLDSVIHPEDKEPRRLAWERAVATAEPLEAQYRLRRASDGQYRWHLGRAVPRLDSGGRVTRWFGTSTDIDDQKIAQRENKSLLEQVRAAADRQRSLLSDVLASVTGGRLCLCETREELPPALPLIADEIGLNSESLRHLRHAVEAAATERQFPEDRWEDLIIAVGEAAMNAVNHAGGGVARVCSNSQRLQVWIEDHGCGIEMNSLHRVTLEQGYTTADSFGHGFWLMLKTVDRFWLLTGPSGTTVVLEQDREIPVPSWLRAYKPLGANPVLEDVESL